MADGWTDDRVLAALAAIAEQLDIPTGVSVPALPGAAPSQAPSRWHRPLLVAAAIVIVALLASLVVAPVREAVARWLGIGSTSIERVPEIPAGLPPFLGAATPISPSEAEALLGSPLPHVGELGAPDGIGRVPEGGVVLAWESGRISLWLHHSSDTPIIIKKLAGMGATVEPVPDLGDMALYIEGEHVFQSPVRSAAAASTVLWLVGDLEHRLEGDLPREDLVRIARSFRT